MHIKSLITAAVLSVTALSAQAEQVKHDNNGKLTIYSEQSKQWLGIEAFWQEVSKQKGGLTWGKSTTYPEYDKVKEHDTLLIELPQGVCLMEFYHERWRRANDVWRWNDELNNYGACPYVFD